jgi:hypothetical protein
MQFLRTQEKNVSFAFDGTRFFSGSKSTEHSGAMLSIKLIEKLQKENPDQKLLDPKFLVNIGLWVPVRSTDFGSPIQSAISKSVDLGADCELLDRQEIEGHPCSVLSLVSAETRHLYFLAEDLSYAIVRHEEFDAKQNKLSRVTVNSKFERYDASWFPRQSVVNIYQWRGFGKCFEKPLAVEKYTVSELSISSGLPNDFVIKPEVGAIVLDSTAKNGTETIRYYEPAGINELEKAVADLAPQNSMEGSRYWNIYTVLLGITLVICCVIYRRATK